MPLFGGKSHKIIKNTATSSHDFHQRNLHTNTHTHNNVPRKLHKNKQTIYHGGGLCYWWQHLLCWCCCCAAQWQKEEQNDFWHYDLNDNEVVWDSNIEGEGESTHKRRKRQAMSCLKSPLTIWVRRSKLSRKGSKHFVKLLVIWTNSLS